MSKYFISCALIVLTQLVAFQSVYAQSEKSALCVETNKTDVSIHTKHKIVTFNLSSHILYELKAIYVPNQEFDTHKIRDYLLLRLIIDNGGIDCYQVSDNKKALVIMLNSMGLKGIPSMIKLRHNLHDQEVSNINPDYKIYVTSRAKKGNSDILRRKLLIPTGNKNNFFFMCRSDNDNEDINLYADPNYAPNSCIVFSAIGSNLYMKYYLKNVPLAEIINKNLIIQGFLERSIIAIETIPQ